MFLARSVAVLVLAAWFSSSSTNYYVSTSGSDSRSGTSISNALLTIQTGIEAARAGDTVYVMGGTYSTGNNIWLQRSGLPGAPITLSNFPGQSPAIQITNLDRNNGGPLLLIRDPAYDTDLTPIGYIIIQGFEITGGWYGIRYDNGHHIVIRNNYIHDNYAMGIGGTGTSILIERNHITRNGNLMCAERPAECTHVHGMYVGGTALVIRNNVITRHPAYGLQCAGFLDTQHQGAYSGFSNSLIANNTFAYNERGSGVVIWLANPGANVTNDTVRNNIFYNNGVKDGAAIIETQGIARLDCGGGHVINNNLFYSSFGQAQVNNGFVIAGCGTYNCAANNIAQADPLFVNPANEDYSLRGNSPAINAGLNVPAQGVSSDIMGTARPQGSAYDIGAYEYGSGSNIRHTAAHGLNSHEGLKISASGGVVKISNFGRNPGATVKVYSLNGAELASFDGRGSWDVVWNPEISTAGVYVINASAGNIIKKAMVFLGK